MSTCTPAKTRAREFRIRFVLDDDPGSSLHDPEGNPLPGPRAVYEANPITPGGGAALTYEEYCTYYGNPDRHVVLGAILEERCRGCGDWKDAINRRGEPAHTSLWGIDTMDDDPEAQYANDTIPQTSFASIPGYLLEITRDLLAEAGLSKRTIDRLTKR